MEDRVTTNATRLMDNQQNLRNPEEQKSIKEEVINVKEEIKVDVAGPSGTTYLPGAVPSPSPRSKLQNPGAGLSKSEHCIRQITSKDVTNALKSLSFGAANQVVNSMNIPELKIPRELEDRDALDTTTLVDLKKFMASCFKLNKDNPGTIVVSEIPLQNFHTEITPTTNCNAETECIPIPNLANDVILTNVIEPKVSKGDKKKTSGTLSDRSDFAVTQRDSLSSIGSNVCRICMTRGRERLISPCNCKGSLANVHLSCLERWLNQVGRNHCELCGFSYPAIRTPRYTVLQALRLWFGNPRNRSHLQSDCLIFWLLSTVTAGLLAVCIVGTQYFVIEGNKFGKLDAPIRKDEGFAYPSGPADSIFASISHRITETAMDFFMAIVLCGYSVTVYLLWKDHYVMWNRWRKANVNVRLLLAPDTNPVPFAPRPGYTVV